MDSGFYNMTYTEKIRKLKELISQGDVVFFGGAGVSTASGIKDFRSEDGLYNEKNNFNYPPETILSKSFFNSHTEEFFKFYREKMNCLGYEPNIVHNTLAKWEKDGLLNAVITQNIDNLHQKAGSKNVIELHGTCMENFCIKCGCSYSAENIFLSDEKIPLCKKCGGIIKPNVVLYEEQLNQDDLDLAVSFIQKAKTLITAGSSLTVYPAAMLPSYFYGDNWVVINNQRVQNEQWAQIVIHDDMAKVFEDLNK